jgi:hypothetical protein
MLKTCWINTYKHQYINKVTNTSFYFLLRDAFSYLSYILWGLFMVLVWFTLRSLWPPKDFGLQLSPWTCLCSHQKSKGKYHGLFKHNLIHLHGCVPFIYLAYDMGVHYITFMGRNLENGKKLTPVWNMNSANMECHYFQRYWCFELYTQWIIPEWTTILVNSAMSITPPKIPSVNMKVWILNNYSCFVWGGPHSTVDIF